MRLAQAARNLSITTDDIVTFLAKKDISIDKDSNTKLDDASIRLLFEHYDTDIPQKQENESQLESSETIQNPVSSPDELNSEESSVESDSEQVTENINELDGNDLAEEQEVEIPKVSEPESLTLDEKQGALIEENAISEPSKIQKYRTVADLLEAEGEHETEDDIVIKAPKISLQGLNVLGKIDLPEPKPKAEKEASDNENKKRKEASKNRAPRRSMQRNSRKELTPQQIREREKKKELRKREEAERKEKKKREQFYKEKVLKPTVEQKKKRKPKKKKIAEQTHNQQPSKPMPKTALGKFWRWLNT